MSFLFMKRMHKKEFGKPSSLLPWVTKLKGKDLMAQIQVDSVIKEMNKVRALNSRIKKALSKLKGQKIFGVILWVVELTNQVCGVL